MALVTSFERFELLDAGQLAALVRRGGEAIAAAMQADRGERHEAPAD